jgi:hypothetical protein
MKRAETPGLYNRGGARNACKQRGALQLISTLRGLAGLLARLGSLPPETMFPGFPQPARS